MRLSPLLPSRFRYLTGDDATVLACLANGGDGCISTISNVAPGLCQKILSSMRHGRLQAAWDLQKRLMPLQACLAGDHPAALKYALGLLGLIDPATRLPIVELNGPAKAAVAIALENPHFGFFRKTSSKLCAAILQQDETAEVVLRAYLTHIDDVRLKRALAAALETGRESRVRESPNRNAALWRGLPTRGDVQH
jgi:hypothetical protein